MIWRVPIFVVGAGLSLWYCVSRFLWIFFFVLLSLIGSLFCLFSVTHEASSSHNTKTLVILHGDQLAVLVIVTGGTQSTSLCCPWGKCPPGGNELYQKVCCVTVTAPEEACYPQEPEGRCRFFHLVHTGSSMANVWLSFRQPPQCFSERHGSCG